MVKLPTLQPRGATIRGPVSSISGNDVANQYGQIADALGTMGKAIEAKAMEDASNEGQAAPYRDADGTLKVDTRSNFSATGRSYNRAAQQAYTARLAGDIRAKGIELTNEAAGNVDAFNASWKGFRDNTLMAVPKEYRGAVTTMLDSEGPQLALGVSERKRKSDLQEFEGNIKSEIQLLDDDMSALARAGGTGTDAYISKQAQLKTLWTELAENPDFTVGDKEAEIAVRRMESRHMSEAMLGTVEKSLETGGIQAARDVANRLMTDDKLSLQPSERRQYANLVNERISNYTAQRKADLKPVQDQSKVIQERLKTGVGLDNDDIDTVARQLAGGGDMAGALELYQSRAVAKTLSSFRLADNATQMTAAESAFSRANGGDDILSAIQGVESEGDPNAISKKGAAGLMQVMPETGDEIAGELGDANFPIRGTREEKQAYLQNPEVSRQYGTHYFNKMMVRYGGDREAALIAYNGGAQRADAWLAAGRDDSKIPKESADYYKKVLNRTGGMSFNPEEVGVAKTFLKGRTDKDATHIDGMKDGFAVKLSRLIDAAPPGIKEGLGIYSGARSVDRQRELWQEALKKYGSVDEARRWVAPPGHSQHNHGNAADMSFNGQSLKNAPAEVVQWVHQNAGKFGLKFPLANENWHIEDDSTRGGKRGPTIAPEIIKEYRQEVTADAKSLFADIKTHVYDKGLTPAVSDLNLLTRQLAVVDDANFRTEVADYFSRQSGIAALQGMQPAQVESLMSSLREDVAGGATTAEAQLLAGMEAAQQARASALEKDPIGYAVNRGMITAPPPLDVAAPDTWGTTFQSLQRGIDVLQARGEVGNVSALRPEMLGQVTRMLETATPGESIQLLSSMSANMRPETYKATLGKLYASGQGRAAATAGALAPLNPAAAEGVLRGQMLLKENPLFAPKKSDDNQAVIDTTLPGSVFAPGFEASRQMLLDSATARYADLSNQAGDTSGELNTDRMETAVKEVTGGLLDMNGYMVVAPTYGMTQDDFDKRLSSITDDDLAGAVTATGQRVTASDLMSQGRLRAVADGRYVLEFGRTESPTYVMRQPSQGNYRGPSTFVLDLRDR